uniref:Cytochrome P450 n=1 Tax=Caenorhabditis tropicalis TaxID=1561998 RepID=A0A1I7TZ60_9PELO
MLMVDEQLKIGPMYSPNPIVIADDMEKGGSDSDSLPSSPTHHHELYRRPWIMEPRATTGLSCKANTMEKELVHYTYDLELFITVNSSRKIVAFGMMHLISVNLWTWFRFVLAKQEAKAHKKAQLKQTFRKYYSSSSSSSSEEIHDLINAVLNSTINNTPATKTVEPAVSRLFALEHFGDVATFLTTCIVE